MGLNDILASLRRSRMNARMRAAYDEFLEKLDAGQVARQALGPGDPMPSFLLPSAEGKLVDSSELLARGPLVITFFRGNWCPYCAATLQALEDALPEFTKAGATLVALTPETGGRALVGKRERALHYEILIDVDLAVGMAFGIVFRVPPLYAALLRQGGVDLAERTGNPFWFLPVPATFVVGPDGIIRQAWIDIDFTRRAEPAEIIKALQPTSPG